ncbi:unnamed protein product [Moneuplotes crassus]|uniref:LisH domain-containing protein n=1 Tax=Euplotes crassus TaxID=5936 RepID=A0AAD1XZ39_EUPCR|nr:unnamed protein product [Moneuplotes crassus]
MESGSENLSKLCKFLICDYLEANGMEVTKDSFLREFENEGDSKTISLKSASALLGYKETIKEQLDNKEHTNVLEIVLDQLLKGSQPVKSKPMKKKKLKKKPKKGDIGEPQEEKYDWGGEKMTPCEEIEEGDYSFGHKKLHAQTPFEVLQSRAKDNDTLNFGKNQSSSSGDDELEKELDDLH